MTRKQHIKIFDNTLAGCFSAHNFLPYQTPYEAGYICKKENGDVYFMGLGYHSWWNEISGKRNAFRIDPYIVISIHKIEKEYKKVSTNMSLKYEIDYRTITTNAASIIAFPDGIISGIGHNRFDWLIQQESDVLEVALKVEKIFNNTILPYINSIATVQRVDEVFNTNLEKYIIHTPSTPDRCMRGLIAAKLAGRENISALTDYYNRAAKEWANNLKQEYEELKDLLPFINIMPAS